MDHWQKVGFHFFAAQKRAFKFHKKEKQTSIIEWGFTFVELKKKRELSTWQKVGFHFFAAQKRHQQIKNLFAFSVLTSLLNAPRVVG